MCGQYVCDLYTLLVCSILCAWLFCMMTVHVFTVVYRWNVKLFVFTIPDNNNKLL